VSTVYLDNAAHWVMLIADEDKALLLHKGYKIMKKPRIPEEHIIFEKVYHHRNRIQHLEREYLDLRIRLRDAEADLRSDPQNQELIEQIDYFKNRLHDLESRYPWISTGRPSEIPFWVMPAG
jgi:hypothetical protein